MSAIAAVREIISGAAGRVRVLDTPGQSPGASAQANWNQDQRDAADREALAFQASYPRGKQCPACSSCRWEIGLTATGAKVWLCAGCKRQPMSQDAWRTMVASAKSARPPAPAPTTADLRAKLATAIADRTTAGERLAALATALRKARAAVGEAQSKRDVAEASLDAARTHNASIAAAALSGAPRETPLDLDACRAQLAAADDALAVATGAADLLAGQEKEARKAAGAAPARVRGAALAVMRAELSGALVERAERLRREFVAEAAAIRELHRAGAMIGGPLVSSAIATLERLGPSEIETVPATARIRTLLAALEDSATAPTDDRA